MRIVQKAGQWPVGASHPFGQTAEGGGAKGGSGVLRQATGNLMDKVGCGL
ncbi:MAG: hypothetical protein AAGC58_09445 [Asticcacaulis sp.]